MTRYNTNQMDSDDKLFAIMIVSLAIMAIIITTFGVYHNHKFHIESMKMGYEQVYDDMGRKVWRKTDRSVEE
jgi:hypothetical protein